MFPLLPPEEHLLLRLPPKTQQVSKPERNANANANANAEPRHRYFGFITKHPEQQRFACHVMVAETTLHPLAESVG